MAWERNRRLAAIALMVAPTFPIADLAIVDSRSLSQVDGVSTQACLFDSRPVLMSPAQ